MCNHRLRYLVKRDRPSQLGGQRGFETRFGLFAIEQDRSMLQKSVLAPGLG